MGLSEKGSLFNVANFPDNLIKFDFRLFRVTDKRISKIVFAYNSRYRAWFSGSRVWFSRGGGCRRHFSEVMPDCHQQKFHGYLLHSTECEPVKLVVAF